jgi:Phosphopantetheine attachment site.
MEDFLDKVAELLEMDQKIDPEMSLAGVEAWDSLTIISFLAMVDIEYEKVMKVADFKEAKTFADLYTYVMEEK